jgi:sugar phosphate isomerase/epimerase
MMDCLDEAEDVGADMFELISGPNPEKDRHRAIDGFAESVHFLGEQAKKRNMVLLVEMFDFNVDKKRLIGSVEDTAELFERIDLEEDVRLLLDLSHIPMVNADIATAVHTLSPWIGHVHVGNTVMQPDDDRYGDSHPYFGYPAGSNDIDELAAFFLALHQIGYIRRERPSTVSFEIIRAPGERESDLVANAKRSLQLAWRTFTAKVGIADGQ